MDRFFFVSSHCFLTPSGTPTGGERRPIRIKYQNILIFNYEKRHRIYWNHLFFLSNIIYSLKMKFVTGFIRFIFREKPTNGTMPTENNMTSADWTSSRGLSLSKSIDQISSYRNDTNMTAEITTTGISNDLQPNSSTDLMNLSSDILESTTATTNSLLDSIDVNEPPTKKCRVTANEKPRLLEDRIGSILSCCICLDLSTLPIYQVRVSNYVTFEMPMVSSVTVRQWSSNVCFMF